MPQQFPLIAKWMPGLKLHKDDAGVSCFLAKDLEVELAKGSQLFLKRSPVDKNPYSVMWTSYENDEAAVVMKSLGETGFLIGARPIAHETAEDLLRDLVDDFKSFGYPEAPIERAKAFLARSKA